MQHQLPPLYSRTMADHKQSATAVLDAQISEAEAKAMSPEEKKFFDAALESLDREQQARPRYIRFVKHYTKIIAGSFVCCVLADS